MVKGVPLVAVSIVDALLVLGLGAAGFLVVALVCAAVLAMLQLVLPSADSGAKEIDDAAAAAEEGAEETASPPAAGPGGLDSGPNA
jgi:hypothetical protein